MHLILSRAVASAIAQAGSDENGRDLVPSLSPQSISAAAAAASPAAAASSMLALLLPAAESAPPSLADWQARLESWCAESQLQQQAPRAALAAGVGKGGAAFVLRALALATTGKEVSAA